MSKTKLFANFLAIFGILIFAAAAFAQSTGFTYQGSLNDNNLPADGNYDFEFRLFGTTSGGKQLGATLQRNNVTATNGTFTVQLDFGADAFPGANRFLEIGVRLAGTPGITILAPRQPVTSAPHAIRSLSAAHADSAANADNATTAATANNALQLGGVAANQFVQTNDTRLNDARNPLPGSAGYVQNTLTQQANSNFNISGNGTIGGNLTVGGAFSLNIVNAQTQYNINGARVLASPGAFNFFAGNLAGFSNTTGSGNAFFGVNAGVFNTTGGNNAFFGFEAGRNNNAGANNSYFGKDAGRLNNAGNDNSFFGNDAGQSNTTGASNSFFGKGAGDTNTTGGSNSFFGKDAGSGNTTAGNNSFFGHGTGQSTTTGGSNSFFGKSAGDTNTTGSNNTIIGNLADVGTNNLTNANAIGHRAFVESSNALVLGGVSGKNGATSNTSVGIGTTAPTADLDIETERDSLSPPNLRITNYDANFGPGIMGRSARGTRSAPSALLNGNILFTINASGHTGSVFTDSSAGIHFVATQNWTDSARGTAIKFLTTSNNTTLDTISMLIDHNGNVGIGVGPLLALAQKLDVLGNIRVGSGTTGCVEDRNGTLIAGVCSSDLIFKKNITPFGNILNNFSKLRPVNFYWRADEFADKHFGTNQSFGLIAQEVEQAFPEMVTTDEQGYKVVNYSKLPLYTIQAVNELKVENDTLKQQLQKQQVQIDELKKIVGVIGAGNNQPGKIVMGK